jgi:hypothetical protein
MSIHNWLDQHEGPSLTSSLSIFWAQSARHLATLQFGITINDINYLSLQEAELESLETFRCEIYGKSGSPTKAKLEGVIAPFIARHRTTLRTVSFHFSFLEEVDVSKTIGIFGHIRKLQDFTMKGPVFISDQRPKALENFLGLHHSTLSRLELMTMRWNGPYLPYRRNPSVPLGCRDPGLDSLLGLELDTTYDLSKDILSFINSGLSNLMTLWVPSVRFDQGALEAFIRAVEEMKIPPALQRLSLFIKCNEISHLSKLVSKLPHLEIMQVQVEGVDGLHDLSEVSPSVLSPSFRR